MNLRQKLELVGLVVLAALGGGLVVSGCYLVLA